MIHGHVKRGTALTNNDLCISRRIWNRLRYIKNSTTDGVLGLNKRANGPSGLRAVRDRPLAEGLDVPLNQTIAFFEVALTTKPRRFGGVLCVCLVAEA